MTARFVEVDYRALANRLDFAFYHLKSHVTGRFKEPHRLSELCRPIKTKTPKKTDYTDQGVPCIKLKNVTGRVLELTDCDFVSERCSDRLTKARPEDIIITATGEGTAGRSDIFVEKEKYVVTGENLLLRPEVDALNPYCLQAMLRTDLVIEQLTTLVRGATGQTHLYWQDIQSIEIPVPDKETQQNCERLYRAAYSKRNEAKKRIAEAKALVTEASGVDADIVGKRKLWFETNFREIPIRLRFDVEYFQPVHKEVLSRMMANGCVPASKLAKLNQSKANPLRAPSSVFNYLDIGSINTELGSYTTVQFSGHEAPTRARRKPKEDDIVVSTVRPNRNAVAVISEQPGNLLVSTGFAVVTPVSVDPLVLFISYKAPPVISQISRRATAAMYPAVKQDDIMEVLVPQLEDDLAERVKESVTSSSKLLKQSDDALEKMKGLAENALTGRLNEAVPSATSVCRQLPLSA
jgi:hypothetical protein